MEHIMKLGNYSVRIPEGREVNGGYVELAHSTVYSIYVANDDSQRECDAVISIDGKPVGTFRLGRYGTHQSHLLLERSSNDNGRFTFFEVESKEAVEAGVQKVVTTDRGLIQVVFKPEKKNILPIPTVSRSGPDYNSCSAKDLGTTETSYEKIRGGNLLRTKGMSFSSPQNSSAGVTGLTGSSSQTFYTVPNLEYEIGAEVIISLRLVCVARVRELNPTTPKANEVPAPV